MDIKGTIAYCTREDHCYPQFAKCLAQLAQRHPDAKILHLIGNDIAESRNNAVLQCEGDWVWFIDSDMLFAAETLERLLSREVDVVQVLCLMRHPPHEPVLYQHAASARTPMPLGEPRLVEVLSCGAGGTLYKKKVFEAIPGPWFNGIIGSEDVNFAQRLRAYGIKLHVDMATPVLHITPMFIRPVYERLEGTWKIQYVAQNGDGVDVPFKTSITRPLPRERDLAIG